MSAVGNLNRDHMPISIYVEKNEFVLIRMSSRFVVIHNNYSKKGIM